MSNGPNLLLENLKELKKHRNILSNYYNNLNLLIEIKKLFIFYNELYKKSKKFNTT